MSTPPTALFVSFKPVYGSSQCIPCFNCFPFQFRGQDYGVNCNFSFFRLSLALYNLIWSSFFFWSIKTDEFKEEHNVAWAILKVRVQRSEINTIKYHT